MNKLDFEKQSKGEVELAVMDFGAFLKKVRTGNKLTYNEFAEILSSSPSPSYLHRIEKGSRNPNLQFRFQVLKSLNWTNEDLVHFLFLYLSKMEKEKKLGIERIQN